MPRNVARKIFNWLSGFIGRPGNIPNDAGREFGGCQCLNPSFFHAQRFLSIDSTEAIEQQLADVGECDGVAARNAFQSDLPNQGAKKTVDCGGVSEIGAASKELLGGFADALVLQAALVVGAEGFIGRLDQ